MHPNELFCGTCGDWKRHDIHETDDVKAYRCRSCDNVEIWHADGSVEVRPAKKSARPVAADTEHHA